MGSFWRRLTGTARPGRQSTRPVRDMSPGEMYEAGGGDLATASPFLQQLMKEADKGRREQRPQPSGRPGHRGIPEPHSLDHTEPATLMQYLLWLDGYIKQGGHPTHYHNSPFTRFVYARSDVVVDSDTEFGSHSRSIIVPRGRKVSCTNPFAYFNGWGHTTLFLMDGYRANDWWVPVFSDPEFETLLTEEHREERARQDHECRHRLGEYKRSRRWNEEQP